LVAGKDPDPLKFFVHSQGIWTVNTRVRFIEPQKTKTPANIFTVLL